MADYLIIGADAAGLSAAVQIKRKKPQAVIKVINKGKIISYGACGIPYVLSGDIESPDKLIHFTPESFERNRGIHVDINMEAVALLPQKHQVQIKDLTTSEVTTTEYGKLLIGTGAVPVKLPFLDYDMDGIFNLHTVEDLQGVLAFINENKPKRAIVIGAGNVGLELVEALDKLGMDILLFDVKDKPVAHWPKVVQEATQNKMAEKGIPFYAKTAVESVSRTGSVLKAVAGGIEYEADILFSVVGTRPATDFCRDKLETLENGAILVDQKGLTSGRDVYAAGDCATAYHKVLNRSVSWPLGSAANKMGRIAGLNMSGEDITFPGVVGTQIFKFFELSLAKTGLSREEAAMEGKNAEVFSASRPDKAGYYPGAVPTTVELIVEKATGKLIGTTVVSKGSSALTIDVAAAAIYSGMSVQELGWFDSAYAPPYAPVWNALISAAFTAAKI
jgi:NADPH-dependent 2,4-dienoyl-CoA reductase/sulfur reductase-like enzyme